MILSLEENVNIYFFNNKNASYRKSYTSYYVSEVASTGGHSSAEGDQSHLSNF